MKNKKEIGLYMIANYMYIGINAISNIFVSKILGPHIQGAISYFNAIDNNLNTFVLGIIRSSVEREIPQIKEQSLKDRYGETAFTLNLFIVFLISAIYLVVYFYIDVTIMKNCALWLAMLNLIKGIYDYCRIWHKANLHISHISYLMIFSSLILPIIVLGFSFYYSYHGFWFGRILIILLSMILLIRWMPYFKLRIPTLGFIKHVVSSGGPIIFFGLIQTIFLSMDKYIINHKNGLEQLGFYSIGAMIFNMMLLLPQSFVGAIYPRFIAKQDENLKKRVERISILVQALCFLISCIGIVITPIFINWILPMYKDSIPIIKTFFFGFVAYSSSQIKYIDLIRIKMVKTLINYSFFSLIFGVIFFVYYIMSSYSIRYMALITSLNFFFLSTAINYAWCKVNNLTSLKCAKILITHIILSFITLFISYYDSF